uniref:Polygalacturonase n=1 Tax=Cryptomeria japonica TaxID=3369 RepID=Q0EEI1_CRYJA|nr:pollen allergen [Cryptomeria japonica]
MAMKLIAPMAFLAMQLIIMAAAEDQSAQIMLDSVVEKYLRSNRSLRKVEHSRHDAINIFNVEKYGAVGDGKHDCTEAFSTAWQAACKNPSAMLLVPGSKKFVVNNLFFNGPCQPHFTFKVDGIIAAYQNPASWKNNRIWLQFAKLTGFTLMGKGVIDGQGKQWWAGQCKWVNGREICNDRDRPTAIKFDFSTGLIIQGLKLMNSPEFHLVFGNCEGVKIIGISITAPRDSPNTDGIDIFASKNFHLQKNTIGTGDDCVAIGTGSSNIVIEDLICGPGHGISIGSLGTENSRAEVSYVHVNGAKFIDTQNGLRIKTWQGGSGMASHIIYENVEMINSENPILINQFYCTSASACQNQRSAVQIQDVTYKNIRGTSATAAAIQLKCSDSMPCKDIKLSDISLKLTSGKIASCLNDNANGYFSGHVIPACKNLSPSAKRKESKSHKHPKTVMVENMRAYDKGNRTRILLGSRPPNCTNKCHGCSPCKAKLVIVHRIMPQEYYPQRWICSCHGKIYHP